MTLKQHADLLVAQGALLEAQVRAHLESVAAFAALVTQGPPEPLTDSPAPCTAKEAKSLRTFDHPNRYACAAGHVHGETEKKPDPEAAPPKEGD